MSVAANRETCPAKSSSRIDTGTAALDKHLLAAAEDHDHENFAGAAAALTEHSDDVSIAMETGSTSSTGTIEAKCSISPSRLGMDPDPEEAQLGGQTQLAGEQDGRAFENNEVDAALRIEFDRGDIAVMEAGKLLREPLMTLQELQAEIRGWYE